MSSKLRLKRKQDSALREEIVEHGLPILGEEGEGGERETISEHDIQTSFCPDGGNCQSQDPAHFFLFRHRRPLAYHQFSPSFLDSPFTCEHCGKFFRNPNGMEVFVCTNEGCEKVVELECLSKSSIENCSVSVKAPLAFQIGLKILSFPDQLILQILEYLDSYPSRDIISFANTCKHWNNLVKHYFAPNLDFRSFSALYKNWNSGDAIRRSIRVNPGGKQVEFSQTAEGKILLVVAGGNRDDRDGVVEIIDVESGNSKCFPEYDTPSQSLKDGWWVYGKPCIDGTRIAFITYGTIVGLQMCEFSPVVFEGVSLYSEEFPPGCERELSRDIFIQEQDIPLDDNPLPEKQNPIGRLKRKASFLTKKGLKLKKKETKENTESKEREEDKGEDEESDSCSDDHLLHPIFSIPLSDSSDDAPNVLESVDDSPIDSPNFNETKSKANTDTGTGNPDNPSHHTNHKKKSNVSFELETHSEEGDSSHLITNNQLTEHNISNHFIHYNSHSDDDDDGHLHEHNYPDVIQNEIPHTQHNPKTNFTIHFIENYHSDITEHNNYESNDNNDNYTLHNEHHKNNINCNNNAHNDYKNNDNANNGNNDNHTQHKNEDGKNKTNCNNHEDDDDNTCKNNKDDDNNKNNKDNNDNNSNTNSNNKNNQETNTLHNTGNENHPTNDKNNNDNSNNKTLDNTNGNHQTNNISNNDKETEKGKEKEEELEEEEYPFGFVLLPSSSQKRGRTTSKMRLFRKKKNNFLELSKEKFVKIYREFVSAWLIMKYPYVVIGLNVFPFLKTDSGYSTPEQNNTSAYVFIIDFDTGTPTHKIQHQLDYPARIYRLKMDEKIVASLAWQEGNHVTIHLMVIDLETGNKIINLPAPLAQDMCWDHKSGIFVTAGTKGIRVYDINTSTLLASNHVFCDVEPGNCLRINFKTILVLTAKGRFYDSKCASVFQFSDVNKQLTERVSVTLPEQYDTTDCLQLWSIYKLFAFTYNDHIMFYSLEDGSFKYKLETKISCEGFLSNVE